MKIPHFRVWLSLTVLMFVAHAASAADPIDYPRQIKPIFAAHCYACHGALKQESSLRLDTAALARKGGESGPALKPGHANESLLIDKVTATDADERMPPPGKGEVVSAADVALLRQWIDEGAKAPADEATPPDPRSHWAYQRPVRPPLPKLRSTKAVSNPVDAFLGAEHERLGLTPAPLAPPTVLLRRVYLDLVGIPPTPEQCAAFLADPSPAAYERVVDRLLASPEYGQRWGRHWMDIWRYSDMIYAFGEVRGSQRHIWHWREWIVNSLNADKGYDRMVTEMLAGDELAPNDPSALAATGFLARNYFKHNRDFWLDNTVEHTARALLAVSLNCARCHDHKYDPIPQQAFYQFRAIFEPHQVSTDPLPGVADPLKDGLPRVYDDDANTPTYLFVRGDERSPDKAHPLKPGVPAVLGGSFDVKPVSLPRSAWSPASKASFEMEAMSAARQELAAATKELADAQAALAAAKKKIPAAKDPAAKHPAVKDTAAKDLAEKDTVEKDPVLKRAELRRAAAIADLESVTARWAADKAHAAASPKKTVADLALKASRAERQAKVCDAQLVVFDKEQALAAVRAKLPAKQKTDAVVDEAKHALAGAHIVLEAAQTAMNKSDSTYTPAFKQYPHTSTGRRLALAHWIANRDNPLTARVAVNHIWLRHFGAPLVDNVSDFGLRSPKPRLAALLDFLAVEFMDSGWSMKHLHRLLVTSEAYRRDSLDTAATADNSADPDNHYFWRMNRRRLEAEALRDSVLAVAGKLDLTRGGPDLDNRTWETCDRRSMYFHDASESQMKFLMLFDGADVTECYRRNESVVPQQALAMLNSSLTLSDARSIVQSLKLPATKGSDGKSAFVRAAFMRVLSREPTAEEAVTCHDFLVQQTARLADAHKLEALGGDDHPGTAPPTDPTQRARENLIHVLLNHNDFVTVR